MTDFAALFDTLNRHQVENIVVGGNLVPHMLDNMELVRTAILDNVL